MSAPLADLARVAVDWTLDLIWDVTLPMSTSCPVCAFWRGVVGGIAATLITLWIVT